jgi:hypothetical protein
MFGTSFNSHPQLKTLTASPFLQQLGSAALKRGQNKLMGMVAGPPTPGIVAPPTNIRKF